MNIRILRPFGTCFIYIRKFFRYIVLCPCRLLCKKKKQKIIQPPSSNTTTTQSAIYETFKTEYNETPERRGSAIYLDTLYVSDDDDPWVEM